MAPSTPSWRGWVKPVLQYSLGAALLAYVLYANWEPPFDKDGQPVGPGLKGLLELPPNYAAAAGVLGLWFVVSGLQFYRWYLLVRAVGLPFTLASAFRLGFVGSYYNAFLPGAIGGDIVKAYQIARATPDRIPTAVSTVVIDRLFGLFGLLWYSALVGGWNWWGGDPKIAASKWLQSIITVAGFGATSMVIGFVLLMLFPDRVAQRLGERLLATPKLGAMLADVWRAVYLYSRRPRVVLYAVLISAAAHALLVVTLHLAVRIFPTGIPGSFEQHFVIAPLGFIAQVFVPAPGGVGGGEAIFGGLYKLFDLAPFVGTTGRLALRVVEWTAGLCGLLIYMRMKASHELAATPTAPPAADVPATAS